MLRKKVRARHPLNNSLSRPERQAKSSERQMPTLFNDHLRTPQTTIEAIMYAVRERGAAALREPTNIERLTGCDQEARDEINNRIARLVAAKEIAV